VICGTVYGITAVVLGLPYPLAIAVMAGVLDLVPSVGATVAGSSSRSWRCPSASRR